MLKKITSFTIDHTKLNEGIYISRTDGDVITYDIRTRKPNLGDYMDNETMHSVEHLFATLVRNSEIADKVIYFGPMGCQTGFYLLVRDVASAEVVAVTKAILTKITEYDGEIPGKSDFECGNYKTLNLEKAKSEAASFHKKIEHISDVQKYPD